ncbi:MAG: hypothetical protein NVS2B5_09490 [Beijerinckiaceae bacterium]
MNVLTTLAASLPANDTHVFLLPLAAAGEAAGLPPTEPEQSEAAVLAASERPAFLARRRLLRRALALRLGSAPADIVVARDAQGAPRVTSAREPIFVSLAARDGLVAIALSDRPVGVDIEIVDAEPPDPAWNILHPRERAWLLAQKREKQPEHFLSLWCAKEAYLKAIGRGLRREPTEIAVCIGPEGALTIEDCGRPARLAETLLRRADLGPSIVACIVLAR